MTTEQATPQKQNNGDAAEAEQIETFARALCFRAGFDPDEEATSFVPYYVWTPSGRVMMKPDGLRPLWYSWVSVARASLEIMKSENLG